MEEVLHRACGIAVEAARFAGTLIRERFGGPFRAWEKGDFGDVVTEVDEQAEKEIIRRIRRHFPDHGIPGGDGRSGKDGDWLWMVDPLDEANHFAIGLPLCAVSITLLHRDEPVLGVICDAHLDQIYVARKGKGAFCGERRLRAGAGGKPSGKMPPGWTQGHQVQKDPVAARLRERLDQGVKRVLRLWAPSLLWCMLARGIWTGLCCTIRWGRISTPVCSWRRRPGCGPWILRAVPLTGSRQPPIFWPAARRIGRRFAVWFFGKGMTHVKP